MHTVSPYCGALGLEGFALHIIGRFAAKTAAASFVAVATVLVSFAPAANAVSYTTSGLSQPLTHLGGTGTVIGQLSVFGSSGTLVDGATINLNFLTFTALNTGIATSNAYSITETMTVNSGTPQQLTIPFNLSINSTDTLTIVGGTTLSFLDAGTLWQVVVNGLTLGLPSGGGTASGWLTAQVTDPPGTNVSQAPLPAALPLFASGLGGMGFFAWWRKRKSAGAAAAG